MIKIRHLTSSVVLAGILSMSYSAALAQDFTGFYGAILGGYEAGIASIDGSDIGVKGGVVGAEFGGTYQLENGVVIGAAADVVRSFAHGELSTGGGGYLSFQGHAEIAAHIRGVLGYSLGNALPYLTAGLAYSQSTASAHCEYGVTQQASVCYLGGFDEAVDVARFGYVIGAGLEVAVTENISLKAEYLYSDFGVGEVTLSPPPLPEDMTGDLGIKSSTVRTGLVLRF